ncbi:serine/threonine-protein kinase 35-like [Amphiura filiformis]|uniref:serine/threonine-protein kinase 35-like n=1 Tax=Amphiura filiformis TaxID=82378 RepID=UPI003B21E5A3
MANHMKKVLASGEYTLEKKVADGTFGSVHKGWRVCALKSIALDKLQGNDQKNKVQMWIDESVSLLTLRGHPRIVEYNKFFGSDDNKKLWIESEYCEGGTLNKYFWKTMYQKQCKDVKHRFMVEIADALAFLHNRGVTHRDMKPDNIMVVDGSTPGEAHIKLSDFGLAKLIASCKYGGELMKFYSASGNGTKYYMAPELYDQHFTRTGDIFSMGLIFNALLQGSSLSSKLFLVVKVHGGPPGKWAHENNESVEIPENIAACLSDTFKQLLKSMLSREWQTRPSAETVHGTLLETTHKDLSINSSGGSSSGGSRPSSVHEEQELDNGNH